MTTMTFDKRVYVDRLRAAGFNEPQARALADGLDLALREEVATKSDIATLRNEIGLLRVEIKSELGTLSGELRGLEREQGDLRGELAGLKGELLAAMKADKIELLKWVMMLVVGQTAVFTA